MKEAAVIFSDITKRFVARNGQFQTVLDRVSFSIPSGKTTVIAGGSGQGKSVTLKLILRLLDADTGSIMVDGIDITRLRGRRLEELRTRFGVLFQGAALFDSMSVYDNIALPLRERTGKSEGQIREQVMQTLDSLDLEGDEEKYPAQLSGGMRKRVGLARALQLEPEIMLFDEPTTGLDPVMTHEIYDLFARMQARLGYTAIIVSHDIPNVFKLADQVIILHEGNMDVFADIEEIKGSTRPHIQEFVQKTMSGTYQSEFVE